MSGGYQSFESLNIWQESMNLCKEGYTLLGRCIDFSLRDQIQRCAVSIPSNISEGFELHTNKAFIRHLFIAKGSCRELRTQLLIAIHQQYIEAGKGHILIDKAKKILSMIYQFIKALKLQIRKA